MAGGSENRSSNESESERYVFTGQEPYLKDIYSQAQKLNYGQQDSGDIAGGIASRYAGRSADAVGGLSSAGRFGSGISDGSNLGVQTLQNAGANPYTQGMLDSAQYQIGNDLERNTLTGIRDNANASNPFGGGSRAQLAEGLAVSDANQQYSDAASNIIGNNYFQDYGRQLGASQDYINAGLNAGQANANYAQNLHQGTQGLVNLGLSGYNSQWIPLQNYAQAVNSPTILGTGSGSSRGSSSSYGSQ